MLLPDEVGLAASRAFSAVKTDILILDYLVLSEKLPARQSRDRDIHRFLGHSLVLVLRKVLLRRLEDNFSQQLNLAVFYNVKPINSIILVIYVLSHAENSLLEELRQIIKLPPVIFSLVPHILA